MRGAEVGGGRNGLGGINESTDAPRDRLAVWLGGVGWGSGRAVCRAMVKRVVQVRLVGAAGLENW